MRCGSNAQPTKVALVKLHFMGKLLGQVMSCVSSAGEMTHTPFVEQGCPGLQF